MAKQKLEDEFSAGLGTIADMAEDTATAVEAAVQAADTPPKKSKSIGTLTMGISLAVFGILCTAAALLPGLRIATVAKLVPLILVPLGAEMLLAHFKNKSRHWYYNWVAIFICFVMLGTGVAASAAPLLTGFAETDYHTSEERYTRQEELAAELENALFDKLSAYSAVSEVSTSVYLYDYTSWSTLTLADLQPSDTGVLITVKGSWASKEAFAAAMAPIVQTLLEAGVPVGSVTFATPYDVDGYEMHLENRYQMKTTAADLVQYTETKEKY